MLACSVVSIWALNKHKSILYSSESRIGGNLNRHQSIFNIHSGPKGHINLFSLISKIIWWLLLQLQTQSSFTDCLRTNVKQTKTLFHASITKLIVLIITKGLTATDRSVLEVYSLINLIVLRILLLSVEGMENVLMGNAAVMNYMKECHAQIMWEVHVRVRQQWITHSLSALVIRISEEEMIVWLIFATMIVQILGFVIKEFVSVKYLTVDLIVVSLQLTLILQEKTYCWVPSLLLWLILYFEIMW